MGDLMVPRICESVVSSHLDELTEEDNSNFRNVDAESSISYSHDAAAAAVTVTSMAYLPQTSVLCELRHEAFEACGPLDSGLVSKWRPKDRVSC